jgi:SlyX protein
MSLEDRLTELEVRLSFIDDAVQGLAGADLDQAQRLAALERAVRELRAEMASVRPSEGHDARDEPPPPHY